MKWETLGANTYYYRYRDLVKVLFYKLQSQMVALELMHIFIRATGQIADSCKGARYKTNYVWDIYECCAT